VEWSGNKELDPALCLRLGDTAVQAALLAVYAAPSDYERWVWLAYAQSVLGLKKQAEICLKRAQELAPPGKKLELFAGKG
jgi:cytochrome c-type biogenesis protein CcmH/NrfG